MRGLIFILSLVWTSPAWSQSVDAISWLTGCWRAIDASGEVTETWTAPPMPAMMGYMVVRRDGQSVSWLQSRIESRDGDLFLVTTSSARRSFRYVWAELRLPADPNAPRRIVFEHDQPRFPQRIAYERVGDQLTMTMSNRRGDDAESHVYSPIDCEGAFQQ